MQLFCFTKTFEKSCLLSLLFTSHNSENIFLSQNIFKHTSDSNVTDSCMQTYARTYTRTQPALQVLWSEFMDLWVKTKSKVAGFLIFCTMKSSFF